eukprot:GHVT01087748.1.p2 GENE.GHVT01087748.1~~GHVT01087748.1.p2  ORF type:complete len:236 (-),score=24.13 GHVT01087748.1:148-855(-)
MQTQTIPQAPAQSAPHVEINTFFGFCFTARLRDGEGNSSSAATARLRDGEGNSSSAATGKTSFAATSETSSAAFGETSSAAFGETSSAATGKTSSAGSSGTSSAATCIGSVNSCSRSALIGERVCVISICIREQVYPNIQVLTIQASPIASATFGPTEISPGAGGRPLTPRFFAGGLILGLFPPLGSAKGQLATFKTRPRTAGRRWSSTIGARDLQVLNRSVMYGYVNDSRAFKN